MLASYRYSFGSCIHAGRLILSTNEMSLISRHLDRCDPAIRKIRVPVNCFTDREAQPLD